MAEPSRFPHLSLPFAFAGAAGGWLCGSFFANPLVWGGRGSSRGMATLVAMALAAAAGALLTHWCAGKRLWYELVDPDPAQVARSDRWPRHFMTVLTAGAATGAIVAAVCDDYDGPAVAAIGGAICAAAFFPVFAVVIVAARRAMRARLGSMVADSDHRAVWGILAMGLSVATLLAIVDWPAWLEGDGLSPWITLAVLSASACVIAVMLLFDARALRHARGVLVPSLTKHDPGEAAVETTVPSLDLGVGDEEHVELARSRTAYRGRSRALALIQGNPEQALSALRAAVRRGLLGLALCGAIFGVHMAATSDSVRQIFNQERCRRGSYRACSRVADQIKSTRPGQAALLYERACGIWEGHACREAARMYSLGEGVPENDEKAAYYYRRACQEGDAASCRAAALVGSW